MTVLWYSKASAAGVTDLDIWDIHAYTKYCLNTLQEAICLQTPMIN